MLNLKRLDLPKLQKRRNSQERLELICSTLVLKGSEDLKIRVLLINLKPSMRILKRKGNAKPTVVQASLLI